MAKAADPDRLFGLALRPLGRAVLSGGHEAGGHAPPAMPGGFSMPSRSTTPSTTFPTGATLDAWTAAVPADFRFAVKASRYLTHMKKLKDPEEPIDRLFRAIDPLGYRLGPVLFQLPGRLARESGPPRRLPSASCRRGMPTPSNAATRAGTTSRCSRSLARHDAAFVISHYAGTLAPLQATSSTLVYVRLHGPGEAYQGSYDDAALDTWADRIAAWHDGGRSVWCFFEQRREGLCAAERPGAGGAVEIGRRAGRALGPGKSAGRWCPRARYRRAGHPQRPFGVILAPSPASRSARSGRRSGGPGCRRGIRAQPIGSTGTTSSTAVRPGRKAAAAIRTRQRPIAYHTPAVGHDRVAQRVRCRRRAC